MGLLQGNKRRAAQVYHYFVVAKLLRYLKQNRLDWPFGRWQAIAKFNKTITQFRNCLNLSRQQCLPSMENQKKIQQLDYPFQTSLKIHSQLTEEDKINYSQSLMRGDALQTLKIISSLNRENLKKILILFPRKHVKPHSMNVQKSGHQCFVWHSKTGRPKIANNQKLL